MNTETKADESISIIGAGQAGLATGYFLKEFGLEFTILADDERVQTLHLRYDQQQNLRSLA